jgi:protein-disulfide isomerase
MRLKYGWLIVLVAIALLVAACGPQAEFPTLGEQATAEQATAADTGNNPTAAVEEQPTEKPAEGSTVPELPVDEGDWHVLGSADAPVTIVEYADFQ